MPRMILLFAVLQIAITLPLAAQNLPGPVVVRGQPSSPQENEDEEADAAPRKAMSRPERVNTANAKPLSAVPDVKDLLQAAAKELTNLRLNASLVGGNKYMVNDCLGVKASAGDFVVNPGIPSLRQEGSGVVMTFSVDRIVLDGLMVRVRPNPNVAKLCKFSKKFGVGGAASNVRLELRVDPLLDLEQCRVFFAGPLRTSFAVGGLNLKPLQNDLDKVAKNMIEDALNRLAEGNMVEDVRKAWTRALGATSCRPPG